MARMDKEDARREAEALRVELRSLLLGKYPSLTEAAKALDVPYASVHRYMSLRAKEQREMPFWFVLMALQDLGMSFDDFKKRAGNASK